MAIRSEATPSVTRGQPRVPLAFLPTPLHALPRFSARLAGPRIWLKRDDLTGLAGGGNKTRKLEFLTGAALAHGADTLITTGAIQSNHCRQTAAAAAAWELGCALVLSGEPPAEPAGNLLLDRLLGAEIVWTDASGRLARLDALAQELRSRGRRPYTITYGGSDPVGALGYVVAAEELHDQCAAIGLGLDAIVIASSSGGTQAGLLAGTRAIGWDVPIIGISVDPPAAELRPLVARLATATSAHLGRSDSFSPDDVQVVDDYLGAGYAVVTDAERSIIVELARGEGIILDPVYTGKAFGGLVKMILRGEFADQRDVLFWHTGGMPAIHAYARDLVR